MTFWPQFLSDLLRLRDILDITELRLQLNENGDEELL